MNDDRPAPAVVIRGELTAHTQADDDSNDNSNTNSYKRRADDGIRIRIRNPKRNPKHAKLPNCQTAKLPTDQSNDERRLRSLVLSFVRSFVRFIVHPFVRPFGRSLTHFAVVVRTDLLCVRGVCELTLR